MQLRILPSPAEDVIQPPTPSLSPSSASAPCPESYHPAVSGHNEEDRIPPIPAPVGSTYLPSHAVRGARNQEYVELAAGKKTNEGEK